MLLALMLLLFVLASVWMTRPLWRRALDAGQRRRAANVAAYRQRLAELEADQAAGLLDDDTAAGLRAELDARLLRDTEAQAAAPTLAASRGIAASALLALLVLLVAGAGYFTEGSWRTQMQIAALPTAQAGSGAEGDMQPSVDQMVAALAQRLEANPNDVNGWALLGRSYFVMERYEDAAKSYAKANAITNSQEPDLLTNEGEALALARDRDLLGRPQQLFDAALALAPEHGKALWYAGLAAEQSGDADTARKHWQALARQELPDSLRAMLDERLGAVSGAAPSSAPAPRPAVTAAAGPVLRVAVSVAPELQAKVPAGATLFVFAKAASGPPMPLAVHRGSASELPREIRLDDSMAMTPAAKLSQFDQWVVTARVSTSGQAQAVSGDLQGSLTVARKDLGETALALVIDQAVP